MTGSVSRARHSVTVPVKVRTFSTRPAFRRPKLSSWRYRGQLSREYEPFR